MGVPTFPYYSLALSWPKPEYTPKLTRATGGHVEGKREFTVEVRGIIAEREEGTSVSLRGPEASGALLLPLRPEDLPEGTVVRIEVERPGSP